MDKDSYIQGIENAKIFIKKATDDVPNDGNYHLVRNDKIIFSNTNLKKVQKVYADMIITIDYEKPIFNGPSVDDIKKSLQDNVYSSLPLDRKPFKKKGGSGSRRFK